MRNNSFFPSLLLVAGLLRLAGTSKNEPWTGHPTTESFLVGGQETTRSHLSRGNDKMTVPFDGLTSDFANEAASLFHEDGGISEARSEVLTVLARQPASSEQSLNATMSDQLIKSLATPVPKFKNKLFSHLPPTLTTSQPEEDGKIVTTQQDLSMHQVQFPTVPSKMVVMDMSTTRLPGLQSLGSTEVGVELTTRLPLSTVSRNLHAFSVTKTELGGDLMETMLTSPEERMEKVTLIPTASQSSQVKTQQMQSHRTHPDVARMPGHMIQVQSLSTKEGSKDLLQKLLLEQPLKIVSRTLVMQPSSLTSFPHGELADETIDPRLMGKPSYQTPQHNMLSFPLLDTPEVLSSKFPPQSVMPENFPLTEQPNTFSLSQFPLSSKSSMTKKAEEHIYKGFLLNPKVTKQVTTQTSNFQLSQTPDSQRESMPVLSLNKATNEVQLNTILPELSKTQLQDSASPVNGQPQADMPTMSTLAYLASSHSGPEISNVGSSSFARTPLPIKSSTIFARHSSEIMSTFQLPRISSTIHEQLPSSGTSTSSLNVSVVPAVSHHISTKPPTANILDRPKTSNAQLPSHSDPQPKSKLLTLNSTGPPTEPVMLGSIAILNTSPNTEIGSTSTSEFSGDSFQEQALETSLSFQVKQQMPGNSATAYSNSRTPQVTASFTPEPELLRTSSITPLHIQRTFSTDHALPKSPLGISILPEVKASPLPIHTYFQSQPSSAHPFSEGMNIPYLAKTQRSNGFAFFSNESQPPTTSVSTRSKLKTNATPVEGRFFLSVDQRSKTEDTSDSVPTKAQPLARPAMMEHQLPTISLGVGTHTPSQNDTETPKTFSSAQVHLQPVEHLKSKLPNTFTPVRATDSQSSDISTTAEPSIQILRIYTSITPGLPLEGTTSLLSAASLASEKNNKEKSSPLPSGQGSTTSASSRRKSSSLGGSGSHNSHHNTTNIPSLMEGRVLSTKTTLFSTGPQVQNAMQSSVGLTPNTNHSDRVAEALDSVPSQGHLEMFPSLPYLSTLIQNTENMVCLQRTPDATKPTTESRTSRQGRTSTHELLALSSTLGLSHIGASSLLQMSPSSLILVKPVFVFIPGDTPKVSVLDSARIERKYEAGLSLTSKIVLDLITPSSTQEHNRGIDPSLFPSQHLAKANPLSANVQQIFSRPVLDASSRSEEAGLMRSSTFSPNPSSSLPREFSRNTHHVSTKNHEAGTQLSALDPLGLEKNDPISLPSGISVKHHHPATPPVMMPVQERSDALSATPGLSSTPLKVLPLHFLTNLSASQRMISPLLISGMERKPPVSPVVMLLAEDNPHGYVSSAAPNNFQESFNTSSTRNRKLSLEMEEHLTPSNASSQELLAKTLPRVQYVPNMVSTFSSPSAEEEHKEPVSLHQLSSKALPTEASPYHTNSFFKSFHFHPVSQNAPTVDVRPRTPLPSTLSSASSQFQTTLLGKHSVVGNQPPPRTSVSAISPVSAHSYFAKLISERVSFDSAELKKTPEEKGKNERNIETHNQRRTTLFLPIVPAMTSGRESTWQFTTPFRLISASLRDDIDVTNLQKEDHHFLLHTIRSPETNVDLKDVIPSLGVEKEPILGTSPSISTILQPNVRETGQAAILSPAPSKEVLLELQKGRNPRIAGPTDDKQDEGIVHSLPTPSVFSKGNEAEFPRTPSLPLVVDTLASGDLTQGSYLQSHPPDISESLLSFETEVQSTLESLSGESNINNDSDALAEVTSSPGELSDFFSHIVGSGVVVTDTAGGGGGGGGGDSLPPWDSNLSSVDQRAHHRRRMRSDDTSLDGYTIVSDDACNSGNYTTKMSLLPVTEEKLHQPPGTFRAEIMLKESRQDLALNIKSCCVSPTTRPAGLDVTCCLFPRPSVECRHIQMHHNGRSQSVTFTIQLFQMLNHSVAYLHCELSICLRNRAECKQNCMENPGSLSEPSEQSSYKTLRNVASLGPVLRDQVELPPGPVLGSDVALILPALLCALAGIVVLMGVVIFFWLHQRHQIRMAKKQKDQGSNNP